MDTLNISSEQQDEPESIASAEKSIQVSDTEPATDNGRNKRSPIRRALSLAASAAFMLVIASCAIMISVSIIMRSNGGRATILGYSLYTVETGSMEPTIPTGALIIGKEIPPKDIKKGDIITFALAGVVTHRVVEVNYDADTDYYSFVTKGDANETNDPNPVPGINVLSVVKASFPFVGETIKFFKPPGAGLLIVVAIGMLIVFIEGSRMYRALRNASIEKKQKMNLCPTPEQPVK